MNLIKLPRSIIYTFLVVYIFIILSACSNRDDLKDSQIASIHTQVAQLIHATRTAETILEKEIDGRTLAERIEFYASHPEALDQMAAKAKAFGRPDTADVIVDDVYRLLAAEG